MFTLSRSLNDDLILEVIEKGLDALGESSKQAIWAFLEKEFNVNRNDLPANIREFQKGLQNIFGLGYSFLDTLFRQYLQEATGKNFQNHESFVACVESLRLDSPSI